MSLLIKNGTVVVIMGAIVLCFGCGSGEHRGNWSEERRDAFKAQCANTDTFRNMVIALRGFENSEFDSIGVKEYDGSVLVDSFGVPVDRMHDELRKERFGHIYRTMNIKHMYSFIVPGQDPFVLRKMKMIMWAQYTMAGEGWGCVMGDYTLDSVRYEHNANPTLVKRNWKLEI